MAEQGVNLLVIQKRGEKKINNFFTLSLLVLIITVFLTAMVLLYMLWIKTSIASFTNKELSAIKTLNNLNVKRAKYLTLAERLSGIQKIVPSNAEFNKRFTAITESIPQSISVEDVSYDRNIITIKMSSSDLAVINNYLENNLKNLVSQKRLQIKSVTIQSFELNVGLGVYSAAVEYAFNM